MRVLIIGCGYVGLPLAEELARRGHEVSGMRRSSWTAPAPITALCGDISNPASFRKLPRHFDMVVNCAAPQDGAPDSYRQLYLEGNKNILAWLTDSPVQTFVYTSSVAVYGQDDGSLVDEASPTEPASETGRTLLQAEHAVFSQAPFRAIVLRVAGIYGPSRGYWLKRFLSGEAVIEGKGDRLINMVHRDDVVGSILTTLGCDTPGTTYNVVDNEPATQLQVFEWLAQYCGKPMPPCSEEASPARRRMVTNKRVSNQKLRKQLNYKLVYPTFREGYAAELTRMGYAR